MRIILLVLLLIPVFIFQSFIFVDTVSAIKVPPKKTQTGMGTIHSNNEKASRKANFQVIK